MAALLVPHRLHDELVVTASVSGDFALLNRGMAPEGASFSFALSGGGITNLHFVDPVHVFVQTPALAFGFIGASLSCIGVGELAEDFTEASTALIPSLGLA